LFYQKRLTLRNDCSYNLNLSDNVQLLRENMAINVYEK